MQIGQKEPAGLRQSLINLAARGNDPPTVASRGAIGPATAA
jgi:hypothetical protein